MQLKMMIGKKLIDSIKIIAIKVKLEGYIEGLKKSLLDKHKHQLQLNEKPTFYVDVPSNDVG